jgi:predicted lipoprotein with Yx(FWY)xxD motif
MQTRPWWHTAAFALLLFCIAAPFAARLLAGPPGGRVHVRWQASVDTATRQRLEAQYRLADPEQLDDRTWRYDLIDPRTDAIRAIVNDPAVADTHDINRGSYALDAAAVRTSRRQRFAGGDAIVAGADALSVIAAVLALVLAGIGLAGHGHTAASTSSFVLGRARSVQHAAGGLAAPLSRWLQRGIPDVNANTAGIFRVLFGLAVLMFFQAYPVDSTRLAPSFDSQIEGPLHAAVIEWLRARPTLVDWVGPWLLATGIAFTAGVVTRLSYALFVAGAIVWAFVAVSFDSTHPHSTLILTLVALLPSRWGDGLSIDRWRKRSSASDAGSRQYGYTVWAPGLVVGIAFAAAAWSKLARPDGWTTWIMNGTVKYHFITDSVNAPVDWGLQLAAHPNLAIVASFGAVAIEAVAITAAFTRSESYRLGVGLGALSLVAGFRIFMGVLWLGWWIPLLGFLPWQRISDLTSRLNSQLPTPQLPAGLGARLVTAAQVAMILFLLGQQVVVSGFGIERAPMFTHYPMYSYTFNSPEEFNAWLPPVHRIVVTTEHGKVELRCRANENLVEALQAALKGSTEAAATVWSAVRACRGEDLSGARAVVFEEDKPVFDWQRLKLTVMPAVAVIGPLSAEGVSVASTAGRVAAPPD